ncbi:carboxypeptidase regulatory-like domain-containing protein [Sphaerotilaceae bacterium SBD11-9]
MSHTPHHDAAQRLRTLAHVAALALSAALVACGGGGGDSAPAPAPAPAGPQVGGVTGRILSASDGQPVVGAAVNSGSTSTLTAADGSFTLTGLAASDTTPVTVSATGYSRTMRITSVRANTTTTLPTQLLPVAATASIYPPSGGTATVAGSTAQVVFPANAIVDSSGAVPHQMVSVQVTPINPAQDPNLMPGDYRTTSNGSPAWLESFGAMSVVLTDASGNAYNLAAGQSATIRIPATSRAATLPTTIPLYWFNESTGLWVQEGSATLGGTAPNRYYEGSVAHFTTWNADDVINTVQVTGCVQNVAGNRVSGARVEADGVSYSGMSNAMTDANGNFSIPMRRDATAALIARSGSLLSNARSVTTFSNNVDLGSDCLVFGAANAAVTIKLTWGTRPLDVDSHLLTPQGDHIAYYSKGSLTAAPYANLDIDDITSYGPEIVSISRLARGTYRYFLHNYSGTFDPGMTGSPVKVELTYDGITSVYTPGAGEGTTMRRWLAFDLVVDSQCRVTVTPVNTWSTSDPVNPNQNGGAVTYCN